MSPKPNRPRSSRKTNVRRPKPAAKSRTGRARAASGPTAGRAGPGAGGIRPGASDERPGASRARKAPRPRAGGSRQPADAKKTRSGGAGSRGAASDLSKPRAKPGAKARAKTRGGDTVRSKPPAGIAPVPGRRPVRAPGAASPRAPLDIPEDLAFRMRAFQESRVILTAIELDVFSAVGEMATAAEVAPRIGASPRGTRMLLDALVALELLSKDPVAKGKEDVYRIGEIAARFLAADAPHDMRLSFHHLINLWGRWSMLTDCVRAGTSVPPPPELTPSPEDRTVTFIAAMHRGASMRAAEVAQAVGAGGIRRMLDVGGGSGAYSIAFARANPDLRAVVFDLPEVVPLTRRYIAEAGLMDRVTTKAGDMQIDDLGTGYDLALVSQICHMWDPVGNMNLLRKCHDALAPGGRVVIQDFILDPDRARPRAAALFALNMLVGTRAGSTYTTEEYEGWLRQVGFAEVLHVWLKGPTGLMIGKKG